MGRTLEEGLAARHDSYGHRPLFAALPEATASRLHEVFKASRGSIFSGGTARRRRSSPQRAQPRTASAAAVTSQDLTGRSLAKPALPTTIIRAAAIRILRQRDAEMQRGVRHSDSRTSIYVRARIYDE